MIQWFLSKTGVEVPMINGSVLASRFDPHKEAVSFLKLHAAILQGVESIFLIGAGNHFIVQELIETYRVARVIVVDSQEDLVEAMSARFSNDLVTWKYVASIQTPNVFQDVSQSLLTKFRVLEAPSAQFLDLNWLRDCVDFLNGHSVPGFYFQLRLRNPGKGPSFCNVLPEEKIGNFGKTKALDLIRAGGKSPEDGTTLILSELVL
ncbi:MAG: hypothetical protein K2X47_08815 [Bdellovibrionales bacterium]|nr:hypothetical protein [Bdellovibrionales bacterium]